MAKKEVRTDLWVYDLLKQANIYLYPQGSLLPCHKSVQNHMNTLTEGSVSAWYLILKTAVPKGLEPHTYRQSSARLF